MEPEFWSVVSTGLNPADWQGLLAFDTETTGLSGGAGTVAFLVGWAELKMDGSEPQIVITQWFLRDLPGEPELVVGLDEEFRAARGLISFNGASFDLPLLRSRWAMNGREFPPLAHRDDLHPARRLWKRVLPSCRLGQLERSVLGIRRPDDVPSALVPSLWFDYLRAGTEADFEPAMGGVLRHHAQDVYSLLCLDLMLASMRHTPSSERWWPTSSSFPEPRGMLRLADAGLMHPRLEARIAVDLWGLLRLLPEPEAEALLERFWQEDGQQNAGLAWADRLKRRADPRARTVWLELWQSSRSVRALEEELKWLEHREKSAQARAQALTRIDEALSLTFLASADRLRLEKRQTRLSARLALLEHSHSERSG
jgi:uncharacterized protein YprB with RNaseH-like and TPR domain